MDELVTFSPSEFIVFPVHLHHQSVVPLTITNVSNSDMLYKIKTTAPGRYCVRPNSDVLPYGTAIDVELVLQAFAHLPPDIRECKDKFQLLVAALPRDWKFPGESRPSPAELWRKVVPKDTFQTKFKVQFHMLSDSDMTRESPALSGTQAGFETRDMPNPAELSGRTLPQNVMEGRQTGNAAPHHPPFLHTSLVSMEGTPVSMSRASYPEAYIGNDVDKYDALAFRQMRSDQAPDSQRPVHLSSLNASQQHESLWRTADAPLQGSDSTPSEGNETSTFPHTTHSPDAGLRQGESSRPRSLSPKSALLLAEAPTIDDRKAALSSDIERKAEAAMMPAETPSIVLGQASVVARVKSADEAANAPGHDPLRTEYQHGAVAYQESTARGADADSGTQRADKSLAKHSTRDQAKNISGVPSSEHVAEIRARVLSCRSAPQIDATALSEEDAQRAAVERAGELMRVAKEQDTEIATVREQLAEARHKLSDAKMAVLPAYDVKYEVDEGARIPIAQVVIMAAISCVILKLLV